MSSEAQRRATKKYVKEKTKRATLVFFPAEMDLWEHLQSQPNKNGYLKRLIRADMEKNL